MCLIWLRQYCIEQMLAWMFSIDKSTVNRYNHKTLVILFAHTPRFTFSTVAERIRRGVKFCGVWLTVIGDGSEQQIVTFTDKDTEKVTFSSKKTQAFSY